MITGMRDTAIWRDGIYGTVVGDAFGLPAVDEKRRNLIERPVLSMTGYRKYKYPAGTWSRASSMTLATTDSIIKRGIVSYRDIMDNLVDWIKIGKYTPVGKSFDVGDSVEKSLENYTYHRMSLNRCGQYSAKSNDNGSLTRMLPVCLFLVENKERDKNAIQVIHTVSALTNAYMESQMACGLYYFIVKSIVENRDKHLPLNQLIQKGIDAGERHYQTSPDLVGSETRQMLKSFGYIMDLDRLARTPAGNMLCSDNATECLTSSVWALCNGRDFEETITKVVNLGNNSQDSGSLTGGLAGLYYGFDKIPHSWVDAIQNRKLIDGVLPK